MHKPHDIVCMHVFTLMFTHVVYMYTIIIFINPHAYDHMTQQLLWFTQVRLLAYNLVRIHATNTVIFEGQKSFADSLKIHGANCSSQSPKLSTSKLSAIWYVVVHVE